MDLKKLRYALCLADEKSFGRAADKLHITQSALSRSIRLLEQELELTLFDRHSNGVHVTMAGEMLLLRARDVVRQANSLRQEASLIRGGKVGSIAFGSGPLGLNVLLPKILPRLLQANPSLKIHIDSQPAVKLLAALLAEKLEFFVADARQLTAHPDIEMIRLGHFSVELFVRKSHPLAAINKVSEAQLIQYPLACPDFVDSHTRSVGEFITPIENFIWAGRVACEDIGVLTTVALQSDAVLLAAREAVAEPCAAGQLVPLQLGTWHQALYSDLRIVKLAGRSWSPLAQLLVDAMAQLFTDSPNQHDD